MSGAYDPCTAASSVRRVQSLCLDYAQKRRVFGKLLIEQSLAVQVSRKCTPSHEALSLSLSLSHTHTHTSLLRFLISLTENWQKKPRNDGEKY